MQITAAGATANVTINDTSTTPVTTDAQFPYTTLLLNGQGTNNSQNNTFLDSSTYTHAITRNGNSTQGTFSPYGGNWSTFIGYGAYGYQSLPAKTVYDITGADFTIEFWINFSTWNTMGSSGATIIGNYNGTHGWVAGWNGGAGSALTFTTFNGSAISTNVVSTGIIQGTDFQLGSWNHITVMQKNNVIYFYLNGVMKYSTTAPVAVGAGQTMYLGVYGQNFDYAGNPYFYYSNLRILKGTGLYSTAGFTPSTTPLTAVANTTLLIGQSSNLVDNSPINATITNTVSGTAPSVQKFNPFSPVITTPTTYSAYFDGTGDNLSLAANASFALGTGDFTIEMWVYNQSTTNRLISYATVGSPILYLNTSNFLLYENYGTGTILTSSIAVPLNTWTHIAVSRASAFTRVFINGVLGASGADTNNWGQNGIYIGTDLATTYMTGSISNLRVVKGTGVYTETFTPSTTPLTAIANTQLLTCQSPTFIDNSTNTFAITAVGNSKPTTVNPFGVTNTSSEYSTTTFGGSGYLDGTGDYLSIPANAAFTFGTNDHTIEFYYYLPSTSLASGYSTQWKYSSSSTQQATNDYYFQIGTAGGSNVGLLLGGGGSWGVLIQPSVSINTFVGVWTHIAWTRSGNTFRLFFNGVQVGTGTYAGSISAQSNPMLLGQEGAGSYAGGYYSNFRVNNGTALYTANFAPPIAPVTAVANTSMLLNFTNAGIIDNAMITNLETIADAKISTTQSKYGTSSIAFDGTGDYFTAPSNAAFTFGTGDFTIEGWFYVNSFGANGFIPFDNRASASAIPFNIGVNSSGNPYLYDGTVVAGSSGITLNTWGHIAWVRTSGVLKMFVNGVSVYSAAYTVNLTGTNCTIGGGVGGLAGYFLNGYIDDFRITKGYARYTSNFTPPENQLAGK